MIAGTTALLLGLVPAQAATSPPRPAAVQATTPAPLTADQAMAGYRAMLAGVERPRAAACPNSAPADPNQITVCGKRPGPSPRLPLPDERFAAGEAVRYRDEPGVSKDLAPEGPHCRMNCEPSRLGETIVKAYKLLRAAVDGEDPTGP